MTDYKNELEQILNRLMISANNHRGNAFLLNSDHRKALSSLEALLSQHSKKRELEARVEEVELFKTTFVTRAIPETNEYANGWNEYRKVVRADVDRIADHRINQLGGQDE